MNIAISSIILLSLLTIGSIVNAQEAVAGVKCHQCNEITDRECGDPYTGEAKACENGETFCRKTVQYVNGKSSVIRQCAKELYKSDYVGCYKTAGKATQTVCTCKGDGCNSGLTYKSSLFAIVLSVLCAYLVKY